MRATGRGRSKRQLLLLALLPLWVACFALTVKQTLQQRTGNMAISVTASAEGGYPVVSGFFPGAEADAPGIEVGDRLLRVGADDLKDAGLLRFRALSYANAAPGGDIPLTLSRRGEERQAVMRLVPVALPWTGLLLALVYASVAALILIRAPESRATHLMYLALLLYSTIPLGFPGGGAIQTCASLAMTIGAAFLTYPVSMLAAIALVDSFSTSEPRKPWWPWIFAALGVLAASWALGRPLSMETGVRGIQLVNVVFCSLLPIVFWRGFLSADPLGRRRLKWVFYGVCAGFMPVVLASMASAMVPSLWWLADTAVISVVLIPVSLFIAMVRFNLFDIDRLISATATYSILTVMLLGALLALAPRVAHAASQMTGLDPGTGQSVFAFLLAALVVPGQRLLRPRLDRLFFAERQALTSGIERLLADLSSSESAQVLFGLAGEKLYSVLRPECCVIYVRARDGEAFAPVFAKGSNVPPAFAPGSPLLEEIERRGVAHSLSPAAAGTSASSVEHAALETLGAELLLPVTLRGSLAAFVCLGGKRSGDVYINTDLALLTAVATRLSGELHRFNGDELHAQARAMQESLRRYVPGAVADRLERGRELEAAARDVSILFVDLRGYTSYSEGHTASEIFSMINRYTEAVSTVVRKHQGSIVDFNGDGLMVVFGAPDAIAQKERAAVAAALEVVSTVRGLSLGGAGGLDVGIGIATGQAFVGNIQAVDRMIWGAIGNTTNLAARLQALSRDLAASIVIDSETRRAAGDLASAFKTHAQLPIKGRQQREDVHALPRAVAA